MLGALVPNGNSGLIEKEKKNVYRLHLRYNSEDQCQVRESQLNVSVDLRRSSHQSVSTGQATGLGAKHMMFVR